MSDLWPIDGTYPSRKLRQVSSALMAGGQAGRPLGARSGVRVGTPASTVSVSGSTWTCRPHAGVLDVQSSVLSGPYQYALGADVTGTVGAAHATLTRIDTLYVQASDPGEDSSTVGGVTVDVAAGTAGSGTAAAVPARAMALAWLSRASAAAGGAVTVQWVAPYTVAAGGIIPVRSAAERDLITWGSTMNPALVYREDIDAIERNVGSGWDLVWGGGAAVQSTATLPGAGPLNNTTWAALTTATWAYVPPRSGLLRVRALLDVQRATTGFGLWRVRAVAGAVTGMYSTFYDHATRLEVVAELPPVRVRSGVGVSLGLQCMSFTGTGGVTLNGGVWEATVE